MIKIIWKPLPKNLKMFHDQISASIGQVLGQEVPVLKKSLGSHC